MKGEASHRRPRTRATPASASAADVVVASKLSAGCRAAVEIFALVEKRATDPTLSVAAANASAFVARIRARVWEQARTMGIALAETSPPVRDRLRLEWLASSVMLGRLESRLLDECWRSIDALLRALPSSHAFEDQAARLRIARAEAYALARAVTTELPGDLLFAVA